MNRTPVAVIAHQGASGYLPENTLPAFARAIELGTDWIELDVHKVQGELFVLHDYRLERVTDQSGSLYAVSMETIRRARVAGQYPIPTLRSVLELVDRRVKLNIEIKSPATAETVIQLLDEYVTRHGWSYNQFLLSSFNQYELLTVQHLCPQVATGVIIYGVPHNLADCTAVLGVRALVNCIEFTSLELIVQAHRLGLQYVVYTVNYPDDIERMLDWGVDGIITNYPDRVRQLRDAQLTQLKGGLAHATQKEEKDIRS